MFASIPQQRMPLPQPQLVGTDVSLLDSRTGWVAEVKVDGWRTIADTGALRLRSRNDRSLNAAFPEVVEAVAALGEDLVLDGELTCLSPDGRHCFKQVSARGRATGRAAALGAVRQPVVYVVWDVLRAGDRLLTTLPWTARRAVLDSLTLSEDPRDGGVVKTVVWDDPAALLQATFDAGLEGIVAKQPGATYRPGIRTNEWIKARHAYHRDSSLQDRRGWRRSN